jgi:hypothetical protein
MRKGIVIEEQIKGCLCMPYVAFGSDYFGATEFNDLTEGCKKGEVSSSDEMEGTCPKCEKPIVYYNYLLVTSE